MSEAVLHVLGAPATAEEIVEKIGAECTSLRAVSAALSAYDRFIRASRRAWGLRVWEIDEYCGIADAIRARIDARGGQIRVDELIDDMLSTFPDVRKAQSRRIWSAWCSSPTGQRYDAEPKTTNGTQTVLA